MAPCRLVRRRAVKKKGVATLGRVVRLIALAVRHRVAAVRHELRRRSRQSQLYGASMTRRFWRAQGVRLRLLLSYDARARKRQHLRITLKSRQMTHVTPASVRPASTRQRTSLHVFASALTDDWTRPGYLDERGASFHKVRDACARRHHPGGTHAMKKSMVSGAGNESIVGSLNARPFSSPRSARATRGTRCSMWRWLLVVQKRSTWQWLPIAKKGRPPPPSGRTISIAHLECDVEARECTAGDERECKVAYE